MELPGKSNIVMRQFDGRCNNGSPYQISPVLEGVTIIDVKGDYCHPRHQHLNYEIVYIDKGHYRCSLNKWDIHLSRNDILIAKPGDWHRDVFLKRSRCFAMQFRLLDQMFDPASSVNIFNESTTEPFQCFTAERKDFWPLLRKIKTEINMNDIASFHVRESLVREFLWRLIRSLPKKVISRKFYDLSYDIGFTTALVSVFQNNIASSVSIYKLAKEMAMSESTFAHKCKKTLGVSPARAFMNYKVEKASLLLKQSPMSIKEISARLGFKDQYHFSKVFKKIYGKPPSNVR